MKILVLNLQQTQRLKSYNEAGLRQTILTLTHLALGTVKYPFFRTI
jgi:hypothetical protein